MKRIFQYARQAARFLLGETTGNDGVASIHRIANHGRRLNDAIQHDSESVTLILLGDVSKRFRAFAVKLQLHGPALIAIISVRFRDAIATKIRFLFDEQTFFDRFLISFSRVLIRLNPILRRNNIRRFVDCLQPLAIVRINESELEFGNARKLLARLLDFRRVEPRNLHENSVLTDRADNRFARTKIIDALPDDFNGLIEHNIRDRLVGPLKPDQEGRAAFDVESQ